MLSQDDLKWIAATSTELNSMLQQISRYADLTRAHRTDSAYVEALSERVELATKMTQALFDRVTSSILAGKAARPAAHRRSGPPAFSVLPAPVLPMRPVGGSSERPTLAVAPAASKERKTPFTVRNAEGGRELLMLVDDDQDVAEIAAQLLIAEGYKIILAKDGVEALKIYREVRDDIRLVILDFFLPVLHGDAVFDELQALNPDIAVVLSSGFAEQTKLGAMLARGLRGFIPKPYSRDKLLTQVRSILDADRAAIA